MNQNSTKKPLYSGQRHFLFELMHNRSSILTSESKQVEESGEAAYKGTQRAV